MHRIKNHFITKITALLFLLTSSLGFASTSVPELLVPWTQWALKDQPTHSCPYHFNNSKQKQCVWASTLVLAVTKKGANFEQLWQVYTPQWIRLVGDKKHWPQVVKLNGQAAIVVEKKGYPSIFIEQAGEYKVSGEFHWQQRPEALAIPAHTGLVSLTKEGKQIAAPEIDKKGRLWLQHGMQNTQKATLENRVELKIYRHIIDDIPLQTVTRVELDIAGQPREIIIHGMMLDQHVPMNLSSKLPARVESDGSLRLQARAGSWVIHSKSRQTIRRDVLQLPDVKNKTSATNHYAVAEEVWVFQARNALRAVEVTGVASIDPQQTSLPKQWRNYPTYLIKQGEVLNLVEKRRGDPDPAANQLELNREFWLDFDGQGYSVKDRITGVMNQDWRLEINDPAQLGRVNVNGRDQFITRLAEDKRAGVEIRQRNVKLNAESRLEEHVNILPAVGWNHDFQSVRATLHLPPGWRVFKATGIDSITNTWLRKWTLLDIFVVLIITIACAKLWRWYWGGIVLTTLVLSYHELMGLQVIALNLLIALALLRVLPANMVKINAVMRFYRNGSILALLLLSIPFMVSQMRQSFYPQLERPHVQLANSQTQSYSYPSSPPMELKTEENEVMPPMQSKDAPSPVQKIQQRIQQTTSYTYNRVPKKSIKKQYSQIDPSIQVQTGQGMPNWHWHRIYMSWSGPVEKQQHINLTLISPRINSILNVLRVILLSLLLAVIFFITFKPRSEKLRFDLPKELPKSSTTASVWMVAAVIGMMSITASPTLFAQNVNTAENVFISPPEPNIKPVAEKSISVQQVAKVEPTIRHINTAYPSAELLAALQQELIKPPACLPYCASIPRLVLSVKNEQLQVRAEIHAAAAVAVPLPASQYGHWLPTQIIVGDKQADTLFRDKSGHIWVYLEKGIHQVFLSGTLPEKNAIQLSFATLTPRFVEATAEGWRIDGLHKNGVVDTQLQLSRIRHAKKVNNDKLTMTEIAPFLQIERTLTLGLDWQIHSRLTRLTPTGNAVVAEIPLLKGESVTEEHIHVKEGHVLVNLSPKQKTLTWTSVFEQQAEFTLTANEDMAIREVWHLNVGEIWHSEITGIPVVHHQNEKGRWLPTWKPWQGEQVSISVQRTKGVTGQILTIDESRLDVTPARNITRSELSLQIRSSRGGQHDIKLPENAQLQSVTINGTLQPIRQEGQRVTVPIMPSAQKIKLVFSQAIGLTEKFTTPRIDIGVENVNTHIVVHMPRNRWILWINSQPMGPSVLIWGILSIILLAAIGLGRVQLTPLKTRHWLLLGIVLSQLPVIAALSVVAWFILLGWRRDYVIPSTSALRFNLIQIGLVMLTVIALSVLITAIHQGLLGHPQMHIAGNGSNASTLYWYQDRSGSTLPEVWVLSLHMLVYRIAMLLWALWLSFAMMRWLRWGWQCFSTDALWKPLRQKITTP